MRQKTKALFAAIVLTGAMSLHAASSRTLGTLSFDVRTTSYDGEYEPDNCGAIWIMDADGNFVKTLKVWAASRKRHLVKWNDDTDGNEIDAVTSATLSNHQSHSVTWDGTTTQGNDVPDGDYTIVMEMTEDNSDSGGEPDGPWHSIIFTKGTSVFESNPADASNFKDMSLTYTPEVSNSAVPSAEVKLKQNYPNPFTPSKTRNGGTTISFELPYDDTVALTIFDAKGRIVRTYRTKSLRKGTVQYLWDGKDHSHKTVAAGTYFYQIKTSKETKTKKAILIK